MQREGQVYYCNPGDTEMPLGKGRTCCIDGQAAVIAMQTGDTLKLVKLSQKNKIAIGIGAFPKPILLPNNKILCVWEEGDIIRFKKV